MAMFDLSWGEIALIGVVALVVIGPKELPGVLRGVGQALGKLRRMASDFQYQFNQALQEAEVDKVKSSINSVTDAVNTTPSSTFNPIDYAREQIKSTVDEIKGQPAPGTIGPTLPDPLAQAVPAPPSYTADPAAIQAAFQPAEPPVAFATPASGAAPATAGPAAPAIGAAPVDPPSGFMAMPAPTAAAEPVPTPSAPPASEPAPRKTDA
jgi:sec-independent protein translocase protein TatB